MFSTADTIAAIASAPGGGARGIVRLSGPETLAVIGRCFRSDDSVVGQATPSKPAVRKGHIVASLASEMLIPADLWCWPDNRSYTREPSVEIHMPGSPPLLEAVLECLCLAGGRLAQPGEFTLRAFLAGRIDLTQAEAVLGIVNSTDRRQLDAALHQMAGGLSRPLITLVDELLNLLADVEAGLDFVDDDIRFVSHGELESRLGVILQKTAAVADQLAARVTEAPITRVVLLGRPNAGKSSLFNALVGRAAAIVSPQPGATRDYLVATLDLDSLSVELVDTAGVAEFNANDAIQSAAQSTAIQQHEQAVLRLLCIDSLSPAVDWDLNQAACQNTLVVHTKCDGQSSTASLKIDAGCSEVIATSSLTGKGLSTLKDAIRRRLTAVPRHADALTTTTARARDSVRLAAECLERALTLVRGRESDDFIAAELRAAWTELGKVLGTVYTDDLLDRIFSRFCIGK